MAELYSDLKVSKPKNSEIEITGSIPVETVAAHFNNVLEDLRKDLELPGFRKGNVPMEMVKARVDAHHALEDAAEAALNEAYPAIIKSESLDVLGRPQVSLTKLAEGNPVEFKIRVGTRPEVKLPDYKKIAAKIMADKKPAEVTDKEIEEVIVSLQKMRSAPSAEEASKEGEVKEEKPLPPLTDEFVKTLGNFENVEDFKKKLKENMAIEKQSEAQKAAREELAAKLAEASKIEIAPVLLDEETEEMLRRLGQDLEHAGISLDDYLKRSNKKLEDIEKEERSYAERQLKTRFILEAIAKTENIEPAEEEVKIESQLLRDRYPDLNPDYIDSYVRGILRNEKTLHFLEGQK